MPSAATSGRRGAWVPETVRLTLKHSAAEGPHLARHGWGQGGVTYVGAQRAMPGGGSRLQEPGVRDAPAGRAQPLRPLAGGAVPASGWRAGTPPPPPLATLQVSSQPLSLTTGQVDFGTVEWRRPWSPV